MRISDWSSDVCSSDLVAASEQEHVLAFRVIGAPGDKVKVRIGRTSGGDQFLADTEAATGWHLLAFVPDDSPFFLQFRNEAAKTLYIDDVALIGAGAAGRSEEHTTELQSLMRNSYA